LLYIFGHRNLRNLLQHSGSPTPLSSR
jgi:hypothetical protein